MIAHAFHGRVRGSSLLDELTAVVVLSVGLLGLAGLHGRVENLAINAESKNLALMLAQNQLEHLRGIAAEPGRAEEGYARIASRSQIIDSMAGQHLNAPFSMRLEVTRFRLQGDAAASGARYLVATDEAPLQQDVPEFKRVDVTVSWVSSGVTHSVAVPGIVSAAVF